MPINWILFTTYSSCPLYLWVMLCRLLTETENRQRLMDAHFNNVGSSRKRPFPGNNSVERGVKFLWIGLLPSLLLVKSLSQLFQSLRPSELTLEMPIANLNVPVCETMLLKVDNPIHWNISAGVKNNAARI